MSTLDDQTFHDAVEGYCGRLSYFGGQTVELHVSTEARTYGVTVERWGATREVVWTATNLDGVHAPAPPDADSEGCGWPVSITFEVDPSWRSGFYLVTMAADGAPVGRDTAHACFVVRGPRSVADRNGLLYVLPTNTWNAYNTWGGKSLYTGGHKVSFSRPFGRGMLSRPEVDRDDRKARPTRYGETPDHDGRIFQDYRTTNAYPSAIGSTGWFTHGRRFVQWAETNGHTFDYAISADLENDATALDGYRGVVLVGHDEYWTGQQRTAIERHVAGGGNLASFSGNTIFWQVRLEEGAGGHSMVCHKYRAHLDDPVVAEGHPELMSGMWADPVVARPEWTLLGAGSAFGLYHRFGKATARGVGGFVIYRDDHWMVAGSGLRYGDVLGAADGVVGYETVGCPLTLDELALPVPSGAAIAAGVPQDSVIVGWVPSSNLGVGEYPASIAALSDQGDLEFIADRIFGQDGTLGPGTGADQADRDLARETALKKARLGNAVMMTTRPNGAEGGEVITIGTTDWVFGLDGDSLDGDRPDGDSLDGEKAVGVVTGNVLRRLSSES